MKSILHSIITGLILSLCSFLCFAQSSGKIRGTVKHEDGPAEFVNVVLKGTTLGSLTDANGVFIINNVPYGTYELVVSAVGYRTITRSVNVQQAEIFLKFFQEVEVNALDEIVITGTMKEVSRAATPVPVEVFTPAFFKANPSPSLFESISMINGVRPQINCNVCNTGDIRINGMQGPYTAVLIDGMPIVSSLSTVYGLNGIPNSLVERIEVVKGPASSLYGSEAMAGIINVITKDPSKAPRFSVDVYGTTWQEYNIDLSGKAKLSKKISLLTGINYFNYQNPIDKNEDGFTDVTLARRISVFNKFSQARPEGRIFSIATRYVYEDRWGGQNSWSKKWRGTDSVYGESIYTKRWELIGQYQLPTKVRLFLSGSFNWHDQNSYYGTTPYMAYQRVSFGQLYWNEKISKHDLLAGITYRQIQYDDNTPGTADEDLRNKPQRTRLPGVFIQDEIEVTASQRLLLGLRYDHDRNHGNIFSPRVAYKLQAGENHTIRASIGTGFRVVNLFTEDHAALTGAREVVITEELKPERSWSGILNYHAHHNSSALFAEWDITGFYTYFTNRIIGDFDSDPDKIIYNNLQGHAITRGISINNELSFNTPFRFMAGVTYMNVYQVEHEVKTQQIQAPHWSGNFTASYTFPGPFITVDITGQWTGPMRLPVFPDDFRPEYSSAYALANFQMTKKFNSGLELYGGIKNIFNFVPDNPLLRPEDPFDKHVEDPINNPHGYTFDTAYNYAPLQGIRGFAGVRFKLE